MITCLIFGLGDWETLAIYDVTAERLDLESNISCISMCLKNFVVRCKNNCTRSMITRCKECTCLHLILSVRSGNDFLLYVVGKIES